MSFHPLLSWLHVCFWCPSALGLPLVLSHLVFLHFCLGLCNHCYVFQHRDASSPLMELTIFAVPSTDAGWKCKWDSSSDSSMSNLKPSGVDACTIDGFRLAHIVLISFWISQPKSVSTCVKSFWSLIACHAIVMLMPANTLSKVLQLLNWVRWHTLLDFLNRLDEKTCIIAVGQAKCKVRHIRSYSYSRGATYRCLLHKPLRWRVQQASLCRWSTDRRCILSLANLSIEEECEVLVEVHLCQ